MKIGVDTNILVYAEGVNGAERQRAINAILAALTEEPLVLPLQALGELFNVLTRKAKWPGRRARAKIVEWRDSAEVVETSQESFLSAIDLAVDHKLTIWDSLILAVAAEAGCRLLLSEDMQDGFTWRGITVVNPFGTSLSPLLLSVLWP